MTRVSPVPREARSFQGQRAGIVSRGAAAGIDLGLVIGALLLTYAGWAAFLFVLDPRSFTFPDTSFLLTFAAGFVLANLYLTLAWTLTGRSYGKHVMGLRVVAANGRRPHFVLAALRAFACTVFPAGLLWVLASRQNRSLQDMFLRTSVVYDWTAHYAGLEPGEAPSPAGPSDRTTG